MNYFEVWVASQRYHGTKPLTYSHGYSLPHGVVVAVELQNRPVLGVVLKQVPKPKFKTKPISKIVSEEPVPVQQLELIEWMRAYYPAPFGSLLQVFLPNSLLQTPRSQAKVSSAKALQASLTTGLTDEQEQALDSILGSSATSYLLHGDTGSGKTRVYSELIEKSLEQNKSAIVMTPEIGLTPQLANTLSEKFGDSVLILHSMLTPAERRSTWFRIISSSKPIVIVGTRSALFSPVKSLGLIIMDESHDFAYKQEQAPHYQASRVAAKLAALHGAKLIMGSATPSVSDYYTLEQKKAPIIRMSKPAIKGTKLPEVEVVRIEDRDNFSKSPYLSDLLIKNIGSALGAREQSLIFLNRRGTARIVMCQRCGWQALCPNCDTALTYHGDKHEMLCHICAYKKPAPSACPECGNADITFRSIGTKYLFQELQRLFPGAVVQRFDTDNMKSERLEQHYKNVVTGKVDILVGTQLLSKGLDLPKLSVIGVILADTGLLIPDYTANEITYQQIYQIIGRVGRGHRKGKVVVQSYQPDNPAIQAAIKRDFQMFYDQEIKERELYRFPPFRYLLKLECERASRNAAEAAAHKLVEDIKRGFPKLEIAGPGPAFHERIGPKYRWQIVLKAKSRQILLEVINSLPSNWAYDIDPANLL